MARDFESVAARSAETLRTTSKRPRVRASDESGQILLLSGLAMVLMLVCTALVVDVGHAMLVQRQLQAGVDAAALAGVQHLPEKAVAEQVARDYSASPGSRNAVNTVDNAQTVATAMCLAGVPGCNRRDGGLNGIKVRSTSTVPTWFGRVIGIKHLKVSAEATACSPCSVKPLDIMIVLDRTGSMCQVGVPPRNQPRTACTDLNAAKSGVRTFLGFMDPTLDKVGLALFPPVLGDEYLDDCPTGTGYMPWDGTPNPNVPNGDPDRNVNGKYYAYDQWWHPDGITSPQGADSSFYVVASLEGADGDLSDDYIVQDANGNWNLNGQSTLVTRLGCAGAEGTTSYALSIEEAQRELDRNGRGNVRDVIIFLSDGGANTSPDDVPTGHWTNNPTSVATPCATGIQAARNAKGPTDSGTIFFAIGYDLAKNNNGGTAEPCRRPIMTPGGNYGHSGGSTLEAPCTPTSGSFCDAEDALKAIASPVDPVNNPQGPRNYYYSPTPQALDAIFKQIALDLSGSRGRLLDDRNPQLP